MDFQATLSLMVIKGLLSYDEAKMVWDELSGQFPPKTLFQCIAQFERAIEKAHKKDKK